MTIGRYKLFDGTLTLGSGPLNVSSQLTNCRVDPSESVTAGEDVPVLSGETLEGEDEIEINYVLSGNFVQDLSDNGVVDYTWSHAGELVPFKFVPNDTAAKAIEGDCYIVPITVGGDVSKTANPRSDFSFRCEGTPTFGDAA